MMDPDLRHIVVTWDLDEGTGLGVRYGDMPAERAAILLELATNLVREHACLIIEDDDEDAEIEFELGYSEDDDDEDDR